MNTFAAIDFETANYSADSACAVGLVIVKGGRSEMADMKNQPGPDLIPPHGRYRELKSYQNAEFVYDATVATSPHAPSNGRRHSWPSGSRN
jgi:hypothetical protein